MKTIREYNTYEGKAIKQSGFGLVASIEQLESEMMHIGNNVAYEMAKARHDEWVACLFKYHTA